MEMTMTGVVLSIVLSGGVALFIAHNYLRHRIGLGLAVMFLLPVLSCATYIYLTAPYFNPPANAQLTGQTPQKIEASPAATLEEIDTLLARMEENPDDAGALLALVGAYMSRENYDASITLLTDKAADFPENDDVYLQLSVAYFAKGLLKAENATYPEALELLEHALSVAPDSAPFLPDLKHFIKMIKNQLAKENVEEQEEQ